LQKQPSKAIISVDYMCRSFASSSECAAWKAKIKAVAGGDPI
jgi:hypothetical protein